LCGATVIDGHLFSPKDDLLNGPKTAVLAYAFWQRHFGGNPQVVGSIMTLDGERYEIIGVIGSSFENGQLSEMMRGNGDVTIEQPPDVYVPFQIDPNSAEHGH
jgi:putative ABC transport system permease protein